MPKTIIDLLKEDHVDLLAGLKRLEAWSQDPDEARTASRAAGEARAVHALYRRHLQWESEVLFPSLREALEARGGGPVPAEIINHLEEEHLAVGRNFYILVQEVAGDPVSPAWGETLASLMATLWTHLRREEDELFPAAERAIPRKGLERLAAAALAATV